MDQKKGGQIYIINKNTSNGQSRYTKLLDVINVNNKNNISREGYETFGNIVDQNYKTYNNKMFPNYDKMLRKTAIKFVINQNKPGHNKINSHNYVSISKQITHTKSNSVFNIQVNENSKEQRFLTIFKTAINKSKLMLFN